MIRFRSSVLAASLGIAVMGACGKEPTSPGISETVVIAFSGRTTGGEWDIYTIREDGTELTNITQSPEADLMPSWSPDHRSIAFYSKRAPAGVYMMNSDGSGVRLLAASQYQGKIAWSPDGQRLVFAVVDDSGGRLLIMRPDGTERRVLLPGAMNTPEWSPDGNTILYTQLAYDGSTGGKNHVFAISPNGGSPKDLTPYGTTSLFYATDPAYSPNGSTIAFARADLDRGLWLMKADGTNPYQITLGEDRRPQWLSATRLLAEKAVGTNNAPRWALYIISADGATETELVTGLQSAMQPSR